MSSRVLIAGGGASGMAAAIAARERGAEVFLFEKKEQLGKKLLKTGNGKCNYSNEEMSVGRYHGHDPEFAAKILAKVSPSDLRAFFQSLGMLTFVRNGGLYPGTERAETVVQALRQRIETLGVKVFVDTEILSAERREAGFVLRTSKGVFEGDRLILALGSEASVSDPNPFRGYDLLKGFGLPVFSARPALVPLLGNAAETPEWAGVRLHAAISFGEQRETGEIQFIKGGISGIPVFQLSGFVGEALFSSKEATVCLDFLPEYSPETLRKVLLQGRENAPEQEIGRLLSLLLPKKLVLALSDRFHGLLKQKAAALNESDLEELVKTQKAFPYRVIATAPLTEAQVASGGLDTRAVSADLEVKTIPGLFVTGELLDIDGACGGYNLHFAFSTGLIAGKEAAR